ncbi:S9 family peptidase [Virgisporangium ochraceum]|uniref:Dipeptidyl aminopeptidase n=1 Tax=Virgisporangium ochraceum TaxID=65505 RepID=A0A8J4EBL5_9ACTN|nr:S9 family peptidase [Virgisporangium ochraceum]GIJ68709.1 dipeptidyl aminopeptidase [Virgisporangium ochraceum]
MKPLDIATARIPGRPAVSPSGDTVVLPLSQIDLDADDYTSHLWIAPADGSAPPRRLTGGWRDGAPKYSPDGAWVGFIRTVRDDDGETGKSQLWVLPTAGGEARKLTDEKLGVGEFAWAPDSARIAYVARVPEEGRYGTKAKVDAGKEPPRRITKLSYHVDDLGYLLDRPRHVFVTAVAEGAEPTKITDGPYDHSDVVWSPAGGLLAFVAARHETYNDDLVADLWVCAEDGSDLRAVTDGTMWSGGPQFTPDGTGLCFHGGDAEEAIVSNVGIWYAPVDGSAPVRRITDEEKYHLAYPGGDIQPLDDGVLFLNEQRGAVEMLLFPYDGGEPTVLSDGERQIIGYHRVGDTLATVVVDAGSWGELYVGDRKLSSWSEGVESFPMEEITGSTSDGYPVHGWVVRPAGGGPHPVLLMIHGGPFTQYGWRLFDEAQVLAAAGYAVVMGNPRGSSGYGQAHGRAVIGDVGAVCGADLIALLDQALKADDLDGSRVGVLGGSHGGFMTTWLAGNHPDRFKAAISERAVNAIDSFTGSSDIGWFFSDGLYNGDATKSPLAYADAITAPMLIIHSEQDWRCPVEQAQRLFVALKRRGATVEMLLFPGEGHELSRTGLPSHRVARFEAIIEWFDRWV